MELTECLVKIVNHSSHPLPSYQSKQAAGMDLRAFIEEPIRLEPFQRTLVKTGIHIALPAGYEAQVRARSGLAIKYGITLVNGPGTIDADYRGEIKVSLINLSQESFLIHDGDRIAQLVITTYTHANWKEVESLSQTERGAGGFGSTGIS